MQSFSNSTAFLDFFFSLFLKEGDAEEGCNILLLSASIGATGISLTSASLVIFAEPFILPSLEDQAISRAHRLRQVCFFHSVLRQLSVAALEKQYQPKPSVQNSFHNLECLMLLMTRNPIDICQRLSVVDKYKYLQFTRTST